MILTREGVVHYLVDRGHLDPAAVFDGGLAVAERPGKNRNFEAEVGGDGGFFIKQAKLWQPYAAATLATEAACFRLAAGGGPFHPLAPVLPAFYGFDPEHAILVLELIPGGETLGQVHRRLGECPSALGGRLGRELGRLHRQLPAPPPGALPDDPFPRRIPWALWAAWHDGSTAGEPSPGRAELLATVRRHPGFEAALAALRRGWRPRQLIHGDMKWENCLVRRGDAGEQELRIVDWELADFGEGSWDVAGVLQSYLGYWIGSMPADEAMPVAEAMAAAGVPLERIQPAVQAFWSGYLDAAGTTGPPQELLERSLAATGARMIQTAYELARGAATLGPAGARLLQLSLNLLTDPGGAARDLLELA